MATFIAVLTLIVSVLAVSYQVRSAHQQERESRRAEQVASAFFDLYGGWAQNRRAQIDPVDTELLRTSAAQYYQSAFRLSALLDDESLEMLKRFMEGGLGDTNRGDESFEALWALHCTVSTALGYHPTPKTREIFRSMFWSHGRNVPSVMIGTIEHAELADEISRARSAVREDSVSER